MIRLVIFDFDGVLADSEPVHYQMFDKVLKENELDLSWAEYSTKYLGYDDFQCFTEVLKDLGRDHGVQQVKTLCERKQELFARYLQENSVLYEGVRDLLDQLQQHNILCSIYSGAIRPEIDLILEQAGLSSYFIDIVTAEDVANGKPDPEGYLLSLKQTNQIRNGQPPITADQCVVIEDSTWGIRAAQAAQMKCLALETSYPANVLADADAIVKSLSDVNVKLLTGLVA